MMLPSKVRFIERPTPPMGGKVFMLDSKGIFTLERGAGTLITVACTHAGSGSIHIVDGVPDENGFFPDGQGVEFFKASPSILGSFMMNAGFVNGLTIKSLGGHASVAPVVTVVWMPFRKSK